MKLSALSSLSVLSLFIGTLTLVGCGGAVSFSNPGSTNTASPPPATPQSVPGPAVEGVSFGGHAPIQNQHVYLLQPGTTGYGSEATSLLGNNGATSAPGYVLTANVSDPNVPVGAKYVTTNSNGEFNLTGAYTCVVGQPVYIYAWGGNFGGTTVFNNNIVQLATLGNCPSSGNFSTAGNGALQYVYLNEVSTVATAYTFQPFTLVTHNDAWHIGTSGTTQGLLGIANAASTAAQLYDIQGGGAQSSCTGAACGEGHIANYRTTGTSVVGGVVTYPPNVGNGVVPEATIDSLANIVASCVDSVPAVVGTPTTQCNNLFTIATDNGQKGGTKPVDSATAVINIARFPAGNYSNGTANVDTTYAADIFALQAAGPTPYIPQLSHAPNDWTVAINYPYTPVGGYTTSNSDVERAESIQVDQLGQLWITAQAGGDGSTNPSPSADRWSPLGVVNSQNSSPGNYIFGYVSIDGSNNAWTGNANSTSGIYFAGNGGNFNTVYGSGYSSAYTVIANNAGDAFFFAQTAATAPNYGMFEYLPGGTLAPGSPFNCCGTTTTGPGPVTQDLNITAASETNTGGANPTYTYSFNFTYVGGTPPTPLAVGDTVPLNLTNDPGTGGIFTRVPGTGWQNLTSVTVASVNGTNFTATGTTRTTNSNNGNGATTTAPINITSASETHTGGNYTYTFDFTYVGGTPSTTLAVGDVVPLNLTNDPGTGTHPVPATGWDGLTSVTVATITNGGTSFTATGTTVTTNTVSANTNGPTVTLNISAVTKSAGGAPYTYTFTATNNATTPLAAGDTVTLALTGHGTGGNNNWAALNGAHTVVNAGTGTFSITSNTNGGLTTDFNNGTGTYPINGATGTGSYQYTNANGATGTGSYVYTGTIIIPVPGPIPSGENVAHGAIDSAGDLWITTETSPYTIARISQTAVPAFTPITTPQQPEFPAIDNSGNAWIAIQATPSTVYKVTPAGGQTVLTSASTGAAMTSTFGAAVDGNGNIWFANRCGNYGGCDTPARTGDNSIFVLNGGGSTPGIADAAISPPQNYIPEAQYPASATTFTPILDGSLNLAIDPSGNLWITNYTGNAVVELVGAAAPVATPLSIAAANNQLGAKP